MALYDSKDMAFYLGQFDITDYSTATSLAATRNMHDATTFGKTGITSHPGTEAPTMSWSGLYDDTAGSGSEAILSTLRDASSSTVVSFVINGAVGNPMYTSDGGWVIDNTTDSSVGSLVLMTSTVNLDQTTKSKSLGDKSTVTASTSGTSIDDSASSSDGGSWVYHIFAISASGGNAQWQIKFQHSANNSTWADASSVNVNAVGAAKTDVSGTLNRYVRQRVVLDASSGSITFAASYNRA